MSGVRENYAAGSAASIVDAVRAGLQERALDADAVTAQVLSEAGADEFHLGGRAATQHVLDKLQIVDGESVMEFGSGIGGPCRQVAVAHPESRVLGVDLTPKFVAAAKSINAFKGIAAQLGDRVSLHDGDCTKLDPATFPAASVDKAFSIHVSMNIQDKRALAQQVARVLKPGGRFAVFDPMANPTPPMTWTSWFAGYFGGEQAAPDPTAVNSSLPFPVPWARQPAESHCATPEAYIEAFKAAGLRLVAREDRTADMLQFISGMQRKMMWHFLSNMTMTPPRLGPTVLMGPTFKTKIGNFKKALTDGQVVMVELVFEKEGPLPRAKV